MALRRCESDCASAPLQAPPPQVPRPSDVDDTQSLPVACAVDESEHGLTKRRSAKRAGKSAYRRSTNVSFDDDFEWAKYPDIGEAAKQNGRICRDSRDGYDSRRRASLEPRRWSRSREKPRGDCWVQFLSYVVRCKDRRYEDRRAFHVAIKKAVANQHGHRKCA